MSTNAPAFTLDQIEAGLTRPVFGATPDTLVHPPAFAQDERTARAMDDIADCFDHLAIVAGDAEALHLLATFYAARVAAAITDAAAPTDQPETDHVR